MPLKILVKVTNASTSDSSSTLWSLITQDYPIDICTDFPIPMPTNNHQKIKHCPKDEDYDAILRCTTEYIFPKGCFSGWLKEALLNQKQGKYPNIVIHAQTAGSLKYMKYGKNEGEGEGEEEEEGEGVREEDTLMMIFRNNVDSINSKIKVFTLKKRNC